MASGHKHTVQELDRKPVASFFINTPEFTARVSCSQGGYIVGCTPILHTFLGKSLDRLLTWLSQFSGLAVIPVHNFPTPSPFSFALKDFHVKHSDAYGWYYSPPYPKL